MNFKEYSVRLMKTFLEIEEGKQIEYQGYIYTIYSLVRGTADNPGVVLLQILENTDLLITGLKNLNSNIKHYIDELTKHSTVAEILPLFPERMEPENLRFWMRFNLWSLVLRPVKDSSVEKSNNGEVVDFIFSEDASVAKYDTLLVKDKSKIIPNCIKHLIHDSFYSETNELLNIK